MERPYIRLILSHHTRSGLSLFSWRRIHKIVEKALPATGMSVFGVLLVVSFVFQPANAHAGILSFVGGLFGSQAGIPAEIQPVNSQTMGLLAPATHIDPNPAKGGGDITVVGGVALLPDAGPSGTIADIEDVQGTEISTYVVRKGDTVSSIAKMFDVSANTILWANDLKRGSTLREGETLVILPVSGIQHTVVKGDTLASIAKKYKGNIDEIVLYNVLSENAALAIGDVIVVPNGEIITPVVPTAGGSARVKTNLPSYGGYYAYPLAGAGHKTQGVHGYNGVDIGAPTGTPIYAAAAGEVIIARNYGWNGGYGQYVVIKHANGTQTLYAHMSQAVAFVGQSVVQRQLIGYVGNTGRSTGAHLHFEVRGAKNPF